MALDISKLKNVTKGPGGGVRAGCPACAAKGEDTQEEHLYIYKDGRFGCAKYPKDKSHRSVIAKLVGAPRVATRSMVVPVRPFKVKNHILKKTFGTNGTPSSNLRAYAKKNILNEINIPAYVKDLEKPVPTVPEFDKSLTDNKEMENEPVPAWMEAEIRSWGWLWEAVDGMDARLVGASWEGADYGQAGKAR